MMQPDTRGLDPNLYRELKPDEQLLWWGRPDPRRRATSMRFTTQAVIYGVLSLLMLFGIVSITGLLSTTSTDLLIPLLLLFLIFVFCLLMFSLFLLLPRIVTSTLSRTVYGITNQRVLVITQGKRGPTTRSHTSSDFGPIERLESGEGWGDISYGRPRFMRMNGIQIRVLDQLNGIPHVRMVEDLLLRVFKDTQSGVPMYWNQLQQMPQQGTSFAQPE